MHSLQLEGTREELIVQVVTKEEVHNSALRCIAVSRCRSAAQLTSIR